MVEAKTPDLTVQDLHDLREGEITECTGEQIMPYGAFVRITKNGRKGMIHISELSYSFVKNISDVLNINDKIEAKVIRIDERGRIDLSLKQTHEPPQAVQKTQYVKRTPSLRENTERDTRGRSDRPDRPERPERTERPKDFTETRDYHELRESMKIPPAGSDESFEQKMSAFLKTSEAKITDQNTRNTSRTSSRSRNAKSSRGRKNNNY